MAKVAESLRDAGEEVLLLDGGGFFPVTPVDDENLRNIAAAGLAAAKIMGYDGMNVTAGDLSQGTAFLVGEAGKAGVPLLAANIVDGTTGRPVGREYVLTEKGGFTVGVVGVVSRGDEETLRMMDHGRSVVIRPPGEILRSLVPDLRKAGADLVLLLSHAGSLETGALMKEVGGIDFAIFSGRNPVSLDLSAPGAMPEPPAAQTTGGGCAGKPGSGEALLEAGTGTGLFRGDLKRIAMGYLRVVREDSGAVRVDRSRVMDLPSTLEEDPRVAALIDMDVEKIMKNAVHERDRQMVEKARELWKMSPLDMMRRGGTTSDTKGE